MVPGWRAQAPPVTRGSPAWSLFLVSQESGWLILPVVQALGRGVYPRRHWSGGMLGPQTGKREVVQGPRAGGRGFRAQGVAWKSHGGCLHLPARARVGAGREACPRPSWGPVGAPSRVSLSPQARAGSPGTRGQLRPPARTQRREAAGRAGAPAASRPWWAAR